MPHPDHGAWTCSGLVVEFSPLRLPGGVRLNDKKAEGVHGGGEPWRRWRHLEKARWGSQRKELLGKAEAGGALGFFSAVASLRPPSTELHINL